MKHFVTLLFCLGSTLAFGQDVIRLKDGEKVTAQVLSVNRHEVKFKRFDDMAGPTYFVSRRDVAELTYGDIIEELLFEKSQKTPEVVQLTETPVRHRSLPESVVSSQGTWLFYLRDCLATFRRVSLRGALVR
ncbi:hypothetical protein [Tellurirhabdus rosea]|uniref:hypothetical protein n=1 Tax=Tellurirhabdus rosea TaxID=2674997 RepID=UPI00224D5194|nr:hypothetical protein [Tellurirhabdus rosea]